MQKSGTNGLFGVQEGGSLDFYQIKERLAKSGMTEIYPDFKVFRSRDLMVRGKNFYAIWDPEKELWSTDEYDVQRLVDEDLMAYKERIAGKAEGTVCVKRMTDFSSNSWTQFRNYLTHISDNAHVLDENLTFQNTEATKKDYVSKRLPYPLEEGTIEAWNEMIGTLYDEVERRKLEWAIGSIVAGDSKDIQKFIVLYGEAGGGKSTMLNIIQKLFAGYYTTFEAKALTSNGNSFSTEVFQGNPLVAIQHDGDLSRIEDNTKLNSIIAHEEMTMNAKYRPSYTARVNCFLFMGTNKPVRISDGKSGIIRRLIDVRTSGRKIPNRRYQMLMSQIDFELGAIAFHCLRVYREMGKNYYSGYKPIDMMLETDVFFNFVEANFYMFRQQDSITLVQAYEMYKTYCDDALIEYKLPRHKFREELKNYFSGFEDRVRVEGSLTRSVYSGFLYKKFSSVSTVDIDEPPSALVLDKETSLLDEMYADCPAQYASTEEIPSKKWSTVDTTLSSIDTRILHYVKLPPNHVVIDFDIEDETGEKSAERNLEAASKWPPTYAEFSKGHNGVHLHYIYDGDTSRLSRIFEEGIEVKVFTGDASLRRKLSKCNNIPVAHINAGLPLKGEKMIDFNAVKSERGLRDLIVRNLNKEIHPGTKPSIDFIYKILEDAYSQGLRYDVTQLRPKVLAFAVNSTHQADYCVKLVTKMKFQSEQVEELPSTDGAYKEDDLVFYDVEVFPNLFLISFKHAGQDKTCVSLINPTSNEIEDLMKFRLVGFNCRRYDNHILYARYIGYDNEQLFQLSSKIIQNSPNSMFREAYSISYADVYDFTSLKQSLKQYEIDLGIHHQELGFPWDQPVPEDQWHLVAEYCDNDVIATEVTFNSRAQDFVARKILAELSGLSVNDTTQSHTGKIVFGNDNRPWDKFEYTDLSTLFPGYTFAEGKSNYRDENPGEGGYVYAEPGMYEDVALLDIASMHPTSIELLNLFGKYTPRYSEIKKARIAIKHKDFALAKIMLGGVLSKYLTSEESADALAYALKIIINIVYGLTSASFPNKFKDSRNIDNIVAKRGALFMIDLKYAVQEQGFTVAHIKTDSIKIPNATPEIIAFIINFGARYGYTFEHEATYSRFCLVNDAVYIARYKGGKHDGEWTAVGAEFAKPYVFKTLFSKESITFDDLCESKSVSSPAAIYLDMNEDLEKDEHNYQFIGKVGAFVPISAGVGGGILLRGKEEVYHAITGTKGYRWLECEVVKSLGKEDDIDRGYYTKLVDDSISHLSEFGDFERFASD